MTCRPCRPQRAPTLSARSCGMVTSTVQRTAPVGPLMSEGGEGLRPVASCAVLRSASSGATRMEPSIDRARPDTGSYRISIDSRAQGRAEPYGRRFRSATIGSTPCDGWRQPDFSPPRYPVPRERHGNSATAVPRTHQPACPAHRRRQQKARPSKFTLRYPPCNDAKHRKPERSVRTTERLGAEHADEDQMARREKPHHRHRQERSNVRGGTV